MNILLLSFNCMVLASAMTSDIGMNLLITLCVISYSGYAIGSFVPMLHYHLVILCLHVNQCLAFSLLSQGNVTFSCSEPQLVAATFQSSSSSFLSLPAPAPILEGFSVRLQFRTWNPDGLLLSNPLISGQEPRYLILQISSGRLHLTHQTSALKISEVSAGEETLSALLRLDIKCRFSQICSSSSCIGGSWWTNPAEKAF